MKISANHSEALLAQLRAAALRIDAIEWVDNLSPATIGQARAEFPSLPFHFHPGRMRFTKAGHAHLNEYLALCPQSPYISIHLAPLPTYVTKSALRRGIMLPAPGTDFMLERFIRQVRQLQQQCNRPVILENMPTLHPTRYRFESEPAQIRRVLDESGCGLLLDLAHARIAAEARAEDVRVYLSALPLKKTVQIHMAGVRRQPDGRLYDAHEALTEEDYRLLEWTLERVQPEWLTLEYFREDPSALLEQLQRLSSLT